MTGSRFLQESLGLLSTYWSRRGVLAAHQVELDDDGEGDLRPEIDLRYTLAASRVLLPVIARIERGMSVTQRMHRRRNVVPVPVLDVPQYVQEHAARLRTRDYPVLDRRDDHELPENLLVRSVLVELMGRLNRAHPKRGSIEFAAQRASALAVGGRLRSGPWSEMPSGNLAVLATAVMRRLHRGQIPSPAGYAALVDALGMLRMAPALPADDSRLQGALLDFPGDPAFADRIFEVWCLKQLGASLARLGGISSVEATLARRRREAAMSFEVGAHTVDVFFQRALPVEVLRYKYENGKPLRGQPDTTLVRGDGRMLIFDAKNRLATRETRPEETFKILGYFESMSPEVRGDAVIVFTGDTLRRTLRMGEARTVELISAGFDADSQAEFDVYLDTTLRRWLET